VLPIWSLTTQPLHHYTCTTSRYNCFKIAWPTTRPQGTYRARNKGRSTDNVRTDCGFDRSNLRPAGHVDRSKFNRIQNEINLRFLLFSCFSCYLSSRCVLRNFDMKSWWHGDIQLETLFTIRASKQTSGFAHFQKWLVRYWFIDNYLYGSFCPTGSPFQLLP